MLIDTDALGDIAATAPLHNHVIEHKIIAAIVAELLAIPEVKTLKMSLDLLLHVALMLENMCADNHLSGKQKGYKAEMAVKIFEKMGFITRDEDKAFVLNGLNFLHSAGKIKRVGFFRRWASKLWRFLCRRASV